MTGDAKRRGFRPVIAGATATRPLLTSRPISHRSDNLLFLKEFLFLSETIAATPGRILGDPRNRPRSMFVHPHVAVAPKPQTGRI